MTAIICLDEKNGLLFNKRRQSRDSVLNEKVLSLAEGKNLLMTAYSAKLFGENEGITVVDDPILSAENDDFCFIEAKIDSLDKIDTLCVFLWNRHYPADAFFEFDLTKEGFVLASTEELAGSSHEKITLNMYNKEG